MKCMVVLDHKDNCPEVYPLADDMVVSDGNIRYQGNDDEIHIREKIRDYPACKTLQERESTVDGIFLSFSVLIK